MATIRVALPAGAQPNSEAYNELLLCRHDTNEVLVGTMQDSILRFPINLATDEAMQQAGQLDL